MTSAICSVKHPGLWMAGAYAGVGLAIGGLTVFARTQLKMGDPAVGSTLALGAIVGAVLGLLSSRAATQGCRR